MVILNDLFKLANDESYHVRDIPKIRGPDLTKYEQVIYECEEKYGKKPTWCCVYGALRETKDVDNQRSMIETCGYWEDRHAGDEAENIRLQILLDVLRDPLIHHNTHSYASSMLGNFYHLISVTNVLKEIYMNTEDGDSKESLSPYILIRSDEFLNTNQGTMYIYTSHWPGKPFSHVRELTEKHIKKHGKDIVMEVLHKLRDTPYTIPKTKRLVKKVLESEMFV